MKLWVGTSGYSYKEWKGNFYPERLPNKEMLAYYAQQLPAVEINNTFYQLPKENVLRSWAEQVPESFRFALKASRRITHIKRLKDAEEETLYLLETAGVLQHRLGLILFQLPPNLKADLARLESFLAFLPQNARVAFEFRHESWLDNGVLDLLRTSGCALCLSDTDEEPLEVVRGTTNWGYLRLRRASYSDEQLQNWLKQLHGQAWEEAFVFFKHEDAGVGPRLAQRLLELASSRATA